MTESLYHTEIINDEGLNGTAYVKDGIAVVTSDPFGGHAGDESGTTIRAFLGDLLERNRCGAFKRPGYGSEMQSRSPR